MDAHGAKVIPWSGKKARAREEETTRAEAPSFAPLDDVMIVIGDEQLEALAATFHMSPARRAMTFEAYLAVRGFARCA